MRLFIKKRAIFALIDYNCLKTMIHYITGGERSGKTSFAQDLALTLSQAPKYVATSRIWDDNHRSRIDRHIADRDHRWTSVEEEKNLSKVIQVKDVVVIDCVTLWLISNEIGMGVHAQTKKGRQFTELQGWMNQHIAQHAHKATVMISGIPLTLK
jgi:adenosylcobinamide kinase/adenosylcobinamide-phosphate guanylyltransferase